MKISIITVCYNSADTIEKTFQSIINQSYQNIELIVVDGKSTDSTLNIINKYKKEITKFISEPDKGLYDAMNKGIAMANGELIGILNSDDVFLDKYVIEKIAEFHMINSIDASVGNVVQFGKQGKIIRKYSAKNWKPEKLIMGFMPPHPSIFFKKYLFQKYGNYHLDFISGADYELIIRFFLKHNISWKFSNITTTAMLIGGISSSGISSYLVISREIISALLRNDIKINSLKIHLRVFWKIFGFLTKK